MSDFSSLFCTFRRAWEGPFPRRMRPSDCHLLFLGFVIPILLITFLQEKAYPEEDLNGIFERGVSLFRDGDMSSAEVAFKAVLKGEPDHALAHFNLGTLFLFQGHLNHAESHLNRAVEIDVTMVPAYLRLSEVQERKGNFEKAIEYLEAGSSKIEDKADPLIETLSNLIKELRVRLTIQVKTREGAILFRSGKTTEAEKRFREVLVLQPKNPEIHRLMAVVSGKQGRLDEAIEHINTSLDLKPDLNESRKMLIDIYIAKDELDVARTELEKAILFIDDKEGQEAVSLEALLTTLEDRIEMKRLTALWIEQDSKKQINAAIATLQEIIKLDPEQITAYLNLGNLLAQKEKFDLAETFLKKAIEINPDYTEAHQRLGQVYEVSRLFKLAREQYEIGLATQNGKIPPMKEILVLSMERNEAVKSQALRAVKQTLEEAKTLLASGGLEQAIELYQRAAFFNPEDLETRYRLAQLYEQNGQRDLANLSLRLIVTSKPEFAAAQRQLAGLDEKGGFFYQALKRWQKYGDSQEVMERLKNKVEELDTATAPSMKEAFEKVDAGQTKAAIELLVKAQALAPDDPRIRIALGRLYTQVSMKKEAFEALNAAGFFESSDGKANYYLGELYETGNQWHDAKAQYDKALKSENMTPALRNKAKVGHKRTTQKVEGLSMAARFYKRARRYQLEEDHRSAIASFETALGLFPDHDWSLYWTAWSYERLSDYQNARKYYLKALDVNPSHRLSHQRLGFIHESEGNIEDAIRSYRHHIDLWNGEENTDTDLARKRLKPLEKRFFVDINQVLLSYDSNPARSENPDPDIRSSIGLRLTYLLKKDRGLQIPIGISTDNTFFFESNTIFSQEVFRISAIRTSAPFIYSIGYNFQYGLARGGSTGSDHIGVFNLSRFTKRNSALRFAYLFDAFISAANTDFDAKRQTIRLTYDKGLSKKRASVRYQFIDNDAKLNDQASQTHGLGFTFAWFIMNDFNASFSYDINRVNFINDDSQGFKKRENIFHSATLDATYLLQEGVILQASYTEQRNSSNLSAGAVTIEQQLSGQSASLGDYSQRLIRMNINWSF